MKTTLFCILLLLSGIVSAQTIDHPPFKARSGSISNITRIERTPENTRVYIHAIFRPHWWIMEDGDTYLEDAATGKKYLFKSAEGIELKKEVYMPDSGTMDYVLVFEPLHGEPVCEEKSTLSKRISSAISTINPTSAFILIFEKDKPCTGISSIPLI